MDPQKIPASRHLDWPQCYNARDLGGLPTADGKETRWRAVVRADIPSRLTAEGQRALVEYGVRTVIDLRPPQEVAKEPSAAFESFEPPITYLNLPVEKYDPQVGVLIQKAASRGEVYCILLDHSPEAVAEIMRAVISAQPGGILIHCQAGKDRTGMISALLLGAAGVPAEIITADYAESQVRLQPYYEKTAPPLTNDDNASFWVRPTATADMMERMLEHIERQYGGVEGYLQSAGLSSGEISQIKSRLTGT